MHPLETTEDPKRSYICNLYVLLMPTAVYAFKEFHNTFVGEHSCPVYIFTAIDTPNS